MSLGPEVGAEQADAFIDLLFPTAPIKLGELMDL